MAMTKVTRNYQLTLPKDARAAANVRIGDKLVVSVENGEIKLKKLSADDIMERAFGVWADFKGDSVDYVRKMRAESEKRLKRMGI